MITKFIIENFRSIEKAEIPLSKINILTGSNNSGKSSVIYALMSFRNFVTAPNSTTDAILNHDFINLGGWENCVFNKDFNREIQFRVETSFENEVWSYSTKFSVFSAQSNLSNQTLKRSVFTQKFSLPYNGSLHKYHSETFLNLAGKQQEFVCQWNGIAVIGLKQESKITSSDAEKYVRRFLDKLNAPLLSIVSSDCIPFNREFTQPIFNTVPLGNKITTKEEIATVLINDRKLQGKVAHYFEKIVAGKTFSISPVPGTHSFYLQVRDKESGMLSDLVNEGTGVNQIVTILAKTLYDKTKTICIDEPEIHLHPSMIEKLVEAIIEIADKEQKQFIISTHSEHFIQNILLNIIRKKLSPEGVNLFFLSKEKGRTSIEKQQINEQGQIEGGLKSFYQDEFKLYKELL